MSWVDKAKYLADLLKSGVRGGLKKAGFISEKPSDKEPKDDKRP